ncbi:MAG: hypothetical protein WC107_01225 [Patescibacteria group bacterium]
MKKLSLALLILASVLFLNPIFASAAESKIADFETNTLEGWNNGSLAAGFSSSKALSLHNSANDSVGATKVFNNRFLNGWTTLEMDVNLNGSTILDGDASGIIFDQGGWKMVPLKKYVNNSQNSWQHVTIPLSDFAGLNTSQGIASMTLRLWNYTAGDYYFDNIKVSNKSITPPITPPVIPPVTPPTTPASGYIIANFDNGLNGFDRGNNNSEALQLQNPANGDASTKKIINSPVLKGYQTIEFDLNLNGAYLLSGDAAIVSFDQGGTRMVSLKNKVTNGISVWQHVKIGLSEFPGLDNNNGIASLSFRFWNYLPGTYNIDNVTLTGNTVPAPITDLTTPSSLNANYNNDKILLTWNGSGPSYIIYRNGNEIARVSNSSYTDTNISAGNNYQYQIKATDGSKVSDFSNAITILVPAVVIPPTNSKWQAQSIDSQVMSKYWAISDDNQIRRLVLADKAIGAKQIAISINYNNYPLMRKWADIIHSEGLNVWFRAHWDEWDSWEKPEIKNGITNIEYLKRTKQFILDHPELFRAGDAFTMCVESENAAWWTGIDHGAFTGWESWRAFTRNQVIYANEAFSQIGLGGKIKTNWINMNGWVAWNVLDQATVNVIGQLTLDHIIDWTDDTGTYVNALFKGNGNGFYGYDEYYNKWKVPMMAGEWGYSTFNQSMDPNHQAELAAAVLKEFSARGYIIGMNYWIDVGHASRLFDTANLLDYTPRPIANIIKQYYI